MGGYAWKRGERGFAGVLSAAMLGAVLWPLRQDFRPKADRVDGFPLSYYPMFSMHRRRHGGITYAVGVTETGERRYLAYNLLGPGGVNQVRRQLYQVAVREGRAAQYAAALAARIAGRRSCADITRVEVVRGKFDLDRCMLGHVVQAEETVLAAAEVPRELTVPAERAPA